MIQTNTITHNNFNKLQNIKFYILVFINLYRSKKNHFVKTEIYLKKYLIVIYNQTFIRIF